MSESAAEGLVYAGAALAKAEASVLSPLRLRDKIVFSTGDCMLGLKETAVGTFLLFYLTAVCGLSGTLAGFALFLSLMVDAFADPYIGYLSDRARSRFGRRHPFMLLSAIPHFVMLGLLFSLPKLEGDLQLFAYVSAVLIALRIANSLFALPYAALGAEISRDYRERSGLGAIRSFSYFLGNIVVVVLGFNVFMAGENGLLSRGAYIAFGWTCAALALAATILCTLGTWRLRHRMHQVEQTGRPDLRGFAREMGEVLRSRSFLILFFTVLVFWTSQGAQASLTVHALKYFWELPSAMLSTVPLAGSIGYATGILVAMLALSRFEKAPVCNAALGAFCVIQFLPVTLRLAGVLPQSGPVVSAVLIGGAVLQGWAISTAVIAFGAMMADAADEHELLFGSRREALYFAGLTFSVKAAIGIGAFVGGVMLDAIKFPGNVAELGPHPDLADAVVLNLGLVSGPGAAAISAITVVVLLGYRIDAKRHATIMEDLAARKASRG